jgi:hypothetical protein
VAAVSDVLATLASDVTVAGRLIAGLGVAVVGRLVAGAGGDVVVLGGAIGGAGVLSGLGERDGLGKGGDAGNGGERSDCEEFKPSNPWLTKCSSQSLLRPGVSQRCGFQSKPARVTEGAGPVISA